MNKNLAVLKPVIAGTPILDTLTVARINAIQDLLRQLWAGENVRSGGNVFVMPSANGPTINVLAGGSGGSSVGGPAPFDVLVTRQSPGFRLDVLPGTVGGILPSNYALTYTTATEAESVFLVATAAATNGVVSSVSLDFRSTVADPIGNSLSVPPSPFSVTLGVLVAGKWYRLTAGSITAIPVEVFRVAKQSFALGEIPYEAYYTWKLGAL